MTRFVALLVGGLLAAPLVAASPDPKDLAIPPQELSKARELVRKLGSETYRDREEAHAELQKMGRLARPALLEGATNDADPEVRFRCSRLLPKAGADDMKARLDTFLADTDGKYEHSLPGLKQFRKSVGTDEKSRALFVEIVKSPYNVELLQTLESGTTEAGRAISDRRSLLFGNTQHLNIGGRVRQPIPLPLSDIACLLLAESLVPSKDIPRSGQWSNITGVYFLQQQVSQSTLNGNNATHAEPFKRIVASWMESRDDPQDLSQLAYVAGQQLINFPQSVPLLRRIVKTEGVYGYAKGQALMFLIQRKKESEVPFLKTLLKDETVVTTVWFGNINPGNPQQNQHQSLVKDVALAFLIQQTGQKMKDYPFSFPQGINPDLIGNQLGYGNYAFTGEDKRAAAMVQFAFWEFKQSLKDPAKKEAEKKEAEKKKDAEAKKDTAPVPPGVKPGLRPVAPPAPVPAPIKR